MIFIYVCVLFLKIESDRIPTPPHPPLMRTFFLQSLRNQNSNLCRIFSINWKFAEGFASNDLNNNNAHFSPVGLTGSSNLAYSVSVPTQHWREGPNEGEGPDKQ